MNAKCEQHIFMPIEGIWRNVSSVDSEQLSDFLERHLIELPEHCEYAIFRVNELNEYIQIREIGAKITVKIWKI